MKDDIKYSDAVLSLFLIKEITQRFSKLKHIYIYTKREGSRIKLWLYMK